MADQPTDSAEKAYAAAAAKAAPKPEPVAPATPALAKSSPPKAAAPAKAPAPAPEPKPTITELKEKIMASAKTPDFTKTMTDAMSDMQAKAKVAYDKGSEFAAEATEFAKGNIEALVESGKILAAAAQDFGSSYAEDAKAAYETATADLKEIAGVKSPTELFQLQGKLMRRNFDTMIAYGSKSTEAMVKLANDSFAPISGRVSAATEKLAKVA